MRIIKEGRLPTGEIEKTCHVCKTVFAYESADVERDRDGHYVECPFCKAFVDVEGDKSKMIAERMGIKQE